MLPTRRGLPCFARGRRYSPRRQAPGERGGTATADDPVADILAELQFKLRRVPTIWASRLHEPSPFKAHRAYQFLNAPRSSARDSLHTRVTLDNRTKSLTFELTRGWASTRAAAFVPPFCVGLTPAARCDLIQHPDPSFWPGPGDPLAAVRRGARVLCGRCSCQCIYNVFYLLGVESKHAH